MEIVASAALLGAQELSKGGDEVHSTGVSFVLSTNASPQMVGDAVLLSAKRFGVTEVEGSYKSILKERDIVFAGSMLAKIEQHLDLVGVD